MSLASIESGIVAIAKKIKEGFQVAEGDAIKLASFLQQNQATITGLAAIAGSKTSNVAATSEAVLGEVITAVKASGDAAAANGFNVPLTAAAVAAVKVLIKDLEAL
jgi:hypothetical protein